jgi:hypothetical protein
MDLLREQNFHGAAVENLNIGYRMEGQRNESYERTSHRRQRQGIQEEAN